MDRSVVTKDGRSLKLVCYEPPVDDAAFAIILNQQALREPWLTPLKLRMSGELNGNSYGLAALMRT